MLSDLSDNEVDGFALLNMTEGDLFVMLPGKVGVARKLDTLIKRWQDEHVRFICTFSPEFNIM